MAFTDRNIAAKQNIQKYISDYGRGVSAESDRMLAREQMRAAEKEAKKNRRTAFGTELIKLAGEFAGPLTGQLLENKLDKEAWRVPAVPWKEGGFMYEAEKAIDEARVENDKKILDHKKALGIEEAEDMAAIDLKSRKAIIELLGSPESLETEAALAHVKAMQDAFAERKQLEWLSKNPDMLAIYLGNNESPEEAINYGRVVIGLGEEYRNRTIDDPSKWTRENVEKYVMLNSQYDPVITDMNSLTTSINLYLDIEFGKEEEIGGGDDEEETASDLLKETLSEQSKRAYAEAIPPALREIFEKGKDYSGNVWTGADDLYGHLDPEPETDTDTRYRGDMSRVNTTRSQEQTQTPITNTDPLDPEPETDTDTRTKTDPNASLSLKGLNKAFAAMTDPNASLSSEGLKEAWTTIDLALNNLSEGERAEFESGPFTSREKFMDSGATYWNVLDVLMSIEKAKRSQEQTQTPIYR